MLTRFMHSVTETSPLLDHSMSLPLGLDPILDVTKTAYEPVDPAILTALIPSFVTSDANRRCVSVKFLRALSSLVISRQQPNLAIG